MAWPWPRWPRCVVICSAVSHGDFLVGGEPKLNVVACRHHFLLLRGRGCKCRIYNQNPNAIQTASQVDVVTANNVTWEDAIQFDPPGAVPGVTGPTWTFQNQNFRMDVKTNINATGPIASWTSSNNQIIVQDINNRILSMNVPESQYSLLGMVPGTYLYDFIMYDGSVPPIRVMLMRGKFVLQEGITGG